jgi:hypothetical protein
MTLMKRILSMRLEQRHFVKGTLIYIHVIDSTHYTRLVGQLSECKLSTEVSMFIFEFLTLGVVSNKVDITLPTQAVLIEIASNHGTMFARAINDY